MGAKKRLRAVAIGAALSVAALGGCAGSPGTAAVIDGRTISQATVERSVTELQPVLATASGQNVVSLLVIAPAFLEAAAEAGFGVDGASARAFVVENGLLTQDAAADLSQGSLTIIRFALLQGSIDSEEDGAVMTAVQTELEQADVELNPRFGTWDPVSLTAQALATPWIVGSAGP